MLRPDTSLTERWLVPVLCSGRPWLGPNLVKVYQSELFAAITEGVVLCAHFKLGSAPPSTQRRMLRHNTIEAWSTMLKRGCRRCPPPMR